MKELPRKKEGDKSRSPVPDLQEPFVGLRFMAKAISPSRDAEA